jgi:N-acetylmuramic acid 6-phosphate etherase
MDSLQNLQTEARNPASARLDELTSVELVALMNAEDATVPATVAVQSRAIAQAIDAITARLAAGGRLIYVGAGTSGRLGVLDASECPPTFQTPPGQVIGLIAGGHGAMFEAVEGAEDSPELGEEDLKALKLAPTDALVGIATSGRTPYVIGAIRYARQVGALTIGLACNIESELEKEVDLPIIPVVGPEILSGSTRLKAGTATKLVLNMLTTGAMVRLGKTFGNLMVDMRATNSKLRARANRIVRTVTGVDEAAADDLLRRCNGELKTAIVVQNAALTPEEARRRLAVADGRVGQVLVSAGRSKIVTPAAERPRRPDLVIGIDGGGTNTIALIADAATGTVIGRGTAGPSNIQAVGVDAASKALDEAIDRAFLAANLPRAKVGAATLGLAGIDRQEGLDVIHGWSARTGLADAVSIANDATLLLAAGTPEGWGLAVIAGTGSIAFVRTAGGEVGRCGGWGVILGDEGSAYFIVQRALRAACRSVDRCGPPTTLLERFLTRMSLKEPPDLIPAVYRGPWDRAAIAGMAPLVFEAVADGDNAATEIVRFAASELAITAVGAARNSGLADRPLPVALAGGVLLGSEIYRDYFLAALRDAGIHPEPVQLVPDPARGAVVLARRLIGA